MPTPVSTARQCLTEEAARVLDDAVTVARRRCHAQTTSLHAVYALLALPSSLLRDACSRNRSPAYSPRLQFRALDLCVSVSLDRLPSAKSSSAGGSSGSSEDDQPPVSNSLMAAIKRSQANQRRQPEMYQITQHITSSICSIASIKVELKNFVISILDDPIVSRVLGDAGFRSTDIKFAILHPPAPPPPARFFRGASASGGRCPPLFLCNLTDSGLPIGGNIPFPFPRADGGAADSDGDANCRRIGEVLVKSSGRNPLLVGVCAKDALASFKECVEKNKGEGVLPSQIVGLDLISLEEEITEFRSNGEIKEVFDSKVEELSSTVEKHSGPGVVVNFGDLRVLMEENGGSEDAIKFLVLKLGALFELHKKKMWLIGATANYETYRKFLDRFPSLETKWDLHPLPITSSRSSVGELSSKSSLMGSFVPFGGFFPTPSDFRSPLSVMKKPFIRCSLCNEKCDRELSAISKGTVSVADQHSSSLPSWLQMANSDANKEPVPEITADNAESNAKELQRKWDDICQRLHHAPKFPGSDALMGNPVIPGSLGFQSIASSQKNGCGNLFSGVSPMLQKSSTQKHNLNAPVVSLCDNFGSECELASQASQRTPQEADGAFSAHYSCNLSLAPDHVSSSSVSSVTTELQLGAFAPSTSQELKKPDSHFNRRQLQLGDYKQIVQKLTQNNSWQIEACYEIARIVSHRIEGNSKHHASNVRQDAWICFIGPDRMGKKRVAEAVAELMFGSIDYLISIDFSIQGSMVKSHSVFDPQLPDDVDLKSGRKSVVDYIAEELRKKPCSVVFLENVDRTNDLLAQTSLSHAVQTGKFRDSRGREISVMNSVFLMACSSTHVDNNSCVKFTEERILEACRWQMQIVVEHDEKDTVSNSSIVTLAMEKTASSTNKRKQHNANKPSSSTHKKPKGFLDLNLPLEEDNDQNSGAWFQDLLGQVETKVEFKPFDFDTLANKLLSKMNLILQRKSRSDVKLEIDHDAMLQILAATWCSGQESAVENWINNVVSETYIEAHRKFCLHKQQTHLKMVSCPGRPIEQIQPGICLPRMINLD